MRQLDFDKSWPESWKYSYPYDEIEIYGKESKDFGYAYAYDNRKRKALELLTSVLPKGSHILDVAAAQGNFSLALAELGYRVTWNDLRSELVDYVKLKHERGDIEFKPGNVFEISQDELYDGVLITEIIEHVAHPDEFLRKIAELVKPGGYIVMTTPNGGYLINTLPRFSDCENPEIFESVQFKPNSDGHIFLLWPDEIVTLGNDANLIVNKVVLFTTSLSHGHLKMRLLLPYIPKRMIRMFDAFVSKLPGFIRTRLSVHIAARYQRPY